MVVLELFIYVKLHLEMVLKNIIFVKNIFQITFSLLKKIKNCALNFSAKKTKTKSIFGGEIYYHPKLDLVLYPFYNGKTLEYYLTNNKLNIESFKIIFDKILFILKNYIT